MIKKKRFLIQLLPILIVLTIIFTAISVNAATIPKLTGFVNDYAEILSPEEEQKLTGLISQIEQETTVEIAILTVPSLEGMPKEEYAIKVVEKTPIGKEGEDNGLLILVVPNERVYRFEVGYGLEGFVPDAYKVRIGERIIKPHFREEKYGEGLFEAIKVVYASITGDNKYVNSTIGSGSIGSMADFQYQRGLKHGFVGPSAYLTIYGMLSFLIILILIGGVGAGLGFSRMAKKRNPKSKGLKFLYWIIFDIAVFAVLLILAGIFLSTILVVFFAFFSLIGLFKGGTGPGRGMGVWFFGPGRFGDSGGTGGFNFGGGGFGGGGFGGDW